MIVPMIVSVAMMLFWRTATFSFLAAFTVGPLL
jgi:hypothetical protein